METSIQKAIEQYLQNRLDTNELDAFKMRVAQDVNLQEKLAFYEDLSTTINRKKLLETALKELEKEGFFHTAKQIRLKPKARKRRIFLIYAASLLLLLSVGVFFFSNIQYSNRALSTLDMKQMIAPEDRGIVRTIDDVQTQSAFRAGISALEATAFDQAILDFQDIDSTANTYIPSRLYLALALYQESNYAQAITHATTTLQKSENHQRKQQAEWMIVQCQLAQGNLDTSFYQKLTDIASTDHLFQKEAHSLQKKLNSLWYKITI